MEPGLIAVWWTRALTVVFAVAGAGALGAVVLDEGRAFALRLLGVIVGVCGYSAWIVGTGRGTRVTKSGQVPEWQRRAMLPAVVVVGLVSGVSQRVAEIADDWPVSVAAFAATAAVTFFALHLAAAHGQKKATRAS